VIYLLAISVFPLAFSVAIAFTSWESGVAPEFVGLANFVTLSGDSRFWGAIETTFLLVLAGLSIELCLGLMIALFLNKEFRGIKLLRGIMLTPMMLPAVTIGMTFTMLLNYYRGPANYFLSIVGLGSVQWLSRYPNALYSIILVNAWQWTPFTVAVLLAGLQSLPVEPQEAARVDGASSLQILRKVTLPMLFPVILAVLLLRSIDAFKLFDVVFVLTGGGPATSTETATLYTYLLGWTFFRFGYASAASFVLLFILSITLLIFIRVVRSRGSSA